MKIEMEGASSRVRLLCCPAASLGGREGISSLFKECHQALAPPASGVWARKYLTELPRPVPSQLFRLPFSCFCDVPVLDCLSNAQEDALRQVPSCPFCRLGNQGFQTDLPGVTWLLKVEFGLELRSDAKAASSAGAAAFPICLPYGYLLFKFST